MGVLPRRRGPYMNIGHWPLGRTVWLDGRRDPAGLSSVLPRTDGVGASAAQVAISKRTPFLQANRTPEPTCRSFSARRVSDDRANGDPRIHSKVTAGGALLWPRPV